MKKLFVLFLIQHLSFSIFSQSISLDPNALQLPRLAVSPACVVADKGKMIYNTTQNKVLFCDGTAWIDPATGGASSDWVTAGSKTYLSNLSGFVGIGTNNPIAPLTIYNSTSASTQYYTSITGTTLSDGLFVGVGFGGKSIIFNYENTDMTFSTNASQRMIIEAGGNVGIGANSPTQKLHVQGNGYFTGNLDSDGLVSGTTLNIGGGTTINKYFETLLSSQQIFGVVNNTCDLNYYLVNGVNTGDTVILNMESAFGTLVVANVRVSSINVVEVKFCNIGNSNTNLLTNLNMRFTVIK